MPSPPSASPLISPDLRRRLTQRFEDAQRLATRPLPDFQQIHLALAECVQADPVNILYLDALLANLKHRDAAAPKQSWLSKLFGGRPRASSKAAQAPGKDQSNTADTNLAYQLLTSAPDLLWSESLNAATLAKLADAAAACEFEEAELRYRTVAHEVEPDDSESLRRLARALTRHGRFQEALDLWIALNAILPADNEAAKAIDDIRSPAPHYLELALKKSTGAKLTKEAQSLIAQAKAALESADFATAEDCLTRAQSAAGGDLGVLKLREDLRLLQSEHHLAVARRRAKSDPHPKSESLMARLMDEHTRLEIDIWNLRAERLPAEADVRVELARRLKKVGNFSGAIQRLAEAQKIAPTNPEVLIVLGECWQHLRQFDKALHFYEQAVAKTKSFGPAEEVPKLARYRAGILCAAMGQRDQARGYFEAVLAADPSFKDARERLDKLRSN